MGQGLTHGQWAARLQRDMSHETRKKKQREQIIADIIMLLLLTTYYLLLTTYYLLLTLYYILPASRCSCPFLFGAILLMKTLKKGRAMSKGQDKKKAVKKPKKPKAAV